MIALISVFWSLGRQIPHVTRSCGKKKLICMESVNFVAFKWVDPFLKKTSMHFAWTHYKFSLKCSKQKWTIKPYEKSFRLSMKIDIKSHQQASTNIAFLPLGISQFSTWGLTYITLFDTLYGWAKKVYQCLYVTRSLSK